MRFNRRLRQFVRGLPFKCKSDIIHNGLEFTSSRNTSRSFLIASGWQSTIFVRTALLSRCWKGSKGQSHLLALWQRRAPERSDEYLEAGRRISLLTRCGNRRKGLGWFCVENYILTASNCVGGDSPREDGDGHRGVRESRHP